MMDFCSVLSLVSGHLRDRLGKSDKGTVFYLRLHICAFITLITEEHWRALNTK